MARAIDVEGLPEQQVRLIEEFVGFLRAKFQQTEKVDEQEENEKIVFATHPSAVKGKLTREEIYDYL